MADGFAEVYTMGDFLVSKGIALRIEEAPWISALMEKLGMAFPPSYRAFITHYLFEPFEYGNIRFFGNQDVKKDGDWKIEAAKYLKLYPILAERSFLQFGKAGDGNFDPVCFNIGQRRPKSKECSIIQFDHEMLLCYNKMRVVKTIAESFPEFLAKCRQDQSEVLSGEDIII